MTQEEHRELHHTLPASAYFQEFTNAEFYASMIATELSEIANNDMREIEGGIIDGVGHAMFGNLEFDNGKPSSSNFDTYRLIRNSEAPDVEVYFVESNEDPTGLGEPSLPPAGGAVANAIYKATGKRMYKQPFVQHEEILG